MTTKELKAKRRKMCAEHVTALWAIDVQIAEVGKRERLGTGVLPHDLYPRIK